MLLSLVLRRFSSTLPIRSEIGLKQLPHPGSSKFGNWQLGLSVPTCSLSRQLTYQALVARDRRASIGHVIGRFQAACHSTRSKTEKPDSELSHQIKHRTALKYDKCPVSGAIAIQEDHHTTKVIAHGYDHNLPKPGASEEAMMPIHERGMKILRAIRQNEPTWRLSGHLPLRSIFDALDELLFRGSLCGILVFQWTDCYSETTRHGKWTISQDANGQLKVFVEMWKPPTHMWTGDTYQHIVEKMLRHMFKEAILLHECGCPSCQAKLWQVGSRGAEETQASLDKLRLKMEQTMNCYFPGFKKPWSL